MNENWKEHMRRGGQKEKSKGTQDMGITLTVIIVLCTPFNGARHR